MGETMSEATEKAMRDYVRRNSEGHSGGRRYDPKDFGIDVPGLRNRIGGYYQRFGVAPDPRFG